MLEIRNTFRLFFGWIYGYFFQQRFRIQSLMMGTLIELHAIILKGWAANFTRLLFYLMDEPGMKLLLS